MKLLIILLCLAIHRYGKGSSELQSFAWTESLLSKLPLSKWPALAGLAVFLTIPLLPLLLLQLLLGGLIGGLLKIAIGIFVLWYCMGPIDWQNVQGPMESDYAGSVLWQFQERVFSILFWFALLGPFGALLYRLVTVLAQGSVHPERAGIAKFAMQAKDLLDWLPVRTFSLLYSLAGNFHSSFPHWLDQVFSHGDNNRQLLAACGIQAAAGQPQEMTVLYALIDRVLLIFLAIVLIFTLGAWFYALLT